MNIIYVTTQLVILKGATADPRSGHQMDPADLIMVKMPWSVFMLL